MDHTVCHPCLQGYALGFPLDIAGDLEGHNPGQGIQAPVVDPWEALAATADCMDCLLRMVDLSFFPLGPWDQVAGHGKNTRNYIRSTKQHRKNVNSKCDCDNPHEAVLILKQIKHAITGFFFFTKSIIYLAAECNFCSTRSLKTSFNE